MTSDDLRYKNKLKKLGFLYMFISYPNNRKVVGIRIYRVLADDTFKFLVTPYISDSTKLTPEEEQAAISLSRDCAPGTRTYIRTILRSDKKRLVRCATKHPKTRSCWLLLPLNVHHLFPSVGVPEKVHCELSVSLSLFGQV